MNTLTLVPSGTRTRHFNLASLKLRYRVHTRHVAWIMCITHFSFGLRRRRCSLLRRWVGCKQSSDHLPAVDDPCNIINRLTAAHAASVRGWLVWYEWEVSCHTMMLSATLPLSHINHRLTLLVPISQSIRPHSTKCVVWTPPITIIPEVASLLADEK